MTTRFIPALYLGGRILLRSGSVDVGAVFPPSGEDQHRYPWVWRLWITGTTTTRDGAAKTELAAKNGLLAAWRDTIARMGLSEADAPADQQERMKA